MDLREAYDRLGVEAGTEPKKARRAYLKLLKVHKPEQDPQGFQAIREAWERIQDAKDWELEQMNRAPEPSNAPPVDLFSPLADRWQGLPWTMPRRTWAQQAILARGQKTEGEMVHHEETARVVSQDADWGSGASRVGAHAATDLGPNSGPDPMVGFLERCARATDAERVAIAREAAATLPDRPEAHRLLHEALIVTSQMEAAADALRVAHRAGLPGFLEPLLRQHPEHLLPEELDEARREAGHSLDPVAVARALLSRQDSSGAVRAMRWGIDAALRGEKDHVPTPHVVLDFVLQLYRHHHPSAARELYDHLRRWMRDAGRETEMRGSQLAASYHLTGELAALPRSFPTEVQAALSRGILDGDPSFAATELAQWTVKNGDAAGKVADDLTVYAPTLHQAVGKFLDKRTAGVYAPLPQPKMKHWADPSGGEVGEAGGDRPDREPKAGPSRAQMAMLGVLVLLIALAVFRVVSQRSKGPEVLPTVPPAMAEVPPDATRLRASADRICERTPSEADPRCAKAHEWADALVANDCGAVRTAEAAFDQAVASATGEANEVALQNILIDAAKFELERGTRIQCASAAPGGPSP